MLGNLDGFVKFTCPQDLTGFTLIIPGVSVGNVPQLAADLLIQTHSMKLTATIWHPGIIPCVGGDPYDDASPASISTACSLYADTAVKLAVLQIRSGIDLKYATKFIKELKNVIQNLKFEKVILLASTFAYELHTISSGHFRYVSNEDVNESMKELSVSPMEMDDIGRHVLHGAGIILKIFELLCDDVRCTMLIKYVSEGDNRPDAYSMIELLYKYVECLRNFKMSDVQCPKSWMHVYGNPSPDGIF